MSFIFNSNFRLKKWDNDICFSLFFQGLSEIKYVTLIGAVPDPDA